VLADDDRLVQVLTNLISNAVKYSPDGGAIEISTRGGPEDVHLSVRDHGLGIPAEEVERIFDRYTRVDSGGGHSILGTGLGLPIVREIVALHDGKVWAESSPGAGSTFHVVLPAHREVSDAN
jgi:signal transduction histidine kinase